MEYSPNREVIAKRIAMIFETGALVNLGIGLPTLVANYIPDNVEILLQSENGFIGIGPVPPEREEDPDLINAGGVPVTILPGGAYFDSAASFGIIRGGSLDYTVLGVLEVDQEGNLANYKIPGKLVPGMGGAMDLVTGAKTVIAATQHFDREGQSKLKRRCSLPLTAAGEVDIVVTDLGLFEVSENRFVLRECFAPYRVEDIVLNTDADILVPQDYRKW
jgi:acetate CoA/acetoacetate CoA-transferase beta subunit